MFFNYWLADNLNATTATRPGEKSPTVTTLNGKKAFRVTEDSTLGCNAASFRAPLAASKLNVNASGIGHYQVTECIM